MVTVARGREERKYADGDEEVLQVQVDDIEHGGRGYHSCGRLVPVTQTSLVKG